MKTLGAIRIAAILLMAVPLTLLATCGEWKAPQLKWQPLVSPQNEQPSESDGTGLPSVLELDELVSNTSKGVRQGDQVISTGSDYDPDLSATTSDRAEAIEVEDTSLNLRAYEIGEYTYAIIPQLVGDGGWGGGRDDDIPLLSLIATEVCDWGGGRDDDIPLLYYIGFADYTLGSWRWYGPFTATNPEITLNSGDLESRFKSPTDMLYLAVLTTAAGKETSQLPREGLVAALPFEPAVRSASQLEDPVGVRVNLVTTDIDSGIGTLPQIVTGLGATVGGSSITLSWDGNPDPHVTMHQVFRENLTLGTAMEWLADVPMPTLEYEDTTAAVDTTYRYSIRAVNDTGAGGMGIVAAEVPTNWQRLTIDGATEDVGLCLSLAIVNGNPAISYYDKTNGDLKYVRATDISGTTWGAPVTVDSEGNVGTDTSLAIISGNPAISYYDFGSHNLKYVRAADASGGSWGTPVTVDSSGCVTGFTSLAVINGNPAISYLDILCGMRYVRAMNTIGTAWQLPVTVDSGYVGSSGYYNCLEVVDGYPALSYTEYMDYDLRYVRADNAEGSSWGTPLTVDSAGEVGEYTSLEVVNGNPAISYYDATDGDLKYVCATDTSGSAWVAPVTVDSTGSVGWYTSLAVVNGYPAISYYDNTSGNLKYVRATNADGSSWGTPLTIDSTGDVGWYTSLAVVGGYPAISYYDFTNGDLKYAYLPAEP